MVLFTFHFILSDIFLLQGTHSAPCPCPGHSELSEEQKIDDLD